MANVDYIKYKIGYRLRAGRTDKPKPEFYKAALKAIPKIKGPVIELLELHLPSKKFYIYKITRAKDKVKPFDIEFMRAAASVFRCYLISKKELDEYNDARLVYYFIGNPHYVRMAYKLFRYSSDAIERSLKGTSKVVLARNKLIRNQIRLKGKTKRKLRDLISLTRAIKTIEVNNIINEILRLTLATENLFINPDYYPRLNRFMLEKFKLLPRKPKHFENINFTDQDYKSITKYYGKKPLQILNYDPTRLKIKTIELQKTTGKS